jgi:hypothetical protein
VPAHSQHAHSIPTTRQWAGSVWDKVAEYAPAAVFYVGFPLVVWMALRRRDLPLLEAAKAAVALPLAE